MTKEALGTLTRTARWLNAGSASHLPPLLCLTDHTRMPEPVAVIRDLPREAGVIFRHYETQNRAALARACQQACQARGLRFLVAGDWRLAMQLRADGVHLPEGLVHRLPRLRRLWPQALITTSVHSLLSVHRACSFGADAGLASPVFPTASHMDAAPLGVLTLTAWAHQTSLPLYALGGMDENSVHRIKGTGILGIAAVGAYVTPKREP